MSLPDAALVFALTRRGSSWWRARAQKGAGHRSDVELLHDRLPDRATCVIFGDGARRPWILQPTEGEACVSAQIGLWPEDYL